MSSSNDTENNNQYKNSLQLDENNMYSVETFQPSDRKFSLPSNSISTSKYTWLTCVPLILLEQFSKMANIYFLIIAVLQSIDSISISGGKPLILIPLTFVVAVNGIKNFLEDYKRKKSDTEENERSVLIYIKSEDTTSKDYFFQTKKWQDIKPGDIVKVYQDEYFPCDMILVASSEESHCYVETKNLDGETNLKYKYFNPEFCKEFEKESKLIYLQAQVKCKPPDDNIYDFEGRIKLSSSKLEQMSYMNNNFYNNLSKSNANAKEKSWDDIRKENITNNQNINLNSNNNFNANNIGKLTKLYREEYHLDKNSFLLRGCSLKQTDWVIGIAVYTGHHTKIMKNSPRARNKLSKIERLMHKQIVFILILQICMSIVATVFLLVSMDKNKKGLETYIFLGNIDESFHWILFNGIFRIGTWILIFTNLVPISLLVTMEMIKYVQGMFISWDADLYCKRSKSGAFVQTSTLNEELGQVSYIFSDKTGTLTRNFMELRKVCIGKYTYGQDYYSHDSSNKNKVDAKEAKENSNNSNNNNNTKDNKDNKDKMLNGSEDNDYENYIPTSQVTNVNFKDRKYTNHLNDSSHDNNKNIKLFLLNLALCHSANTNFSHIKSQHMDNNNSNNSKDKNSTINHAESFLEMSFENLKELKLQASSPDEVALINFAKYSGYEFIFKTDSNEMYLKINGSNYIYKLLHIFEYTSERKRMSVIVRTPENKIYLFTKGADSVILPKTTQNLDKVQITKDVLIDFARDGLRTLTTSYRELTEVELNEIDQSKDMILRTQGSKGLESFYSYVERDFYLLGCTAIEDHLQDNVKETLEKFINTGIKVWMLTGDKLDTAKSIAFSCGLISHEHVIFQLEENMSFADLENTLYDYNKQVVSNPENKHSLVLGMDEISKIMGDDSLKNSFYDLSSKCDSVLCCRVTPKQKAQVVQLYKKKQPEKVTLAIGDGANDVNMITSAHIGVGMLGVEGLQAARASDYSIAEFSFLSKLLFVHGRESYRKNSFVVCYNFYKNALFVMPQFWFGLVSMYSGQTLYDPWIYQLFNIFFTCLPIIWYGCMDSEISNEELLANTNYYKQGMKNYLFNTKRFWKHVFIAGIQSFFIFLFCFNTNDGSNDFTGRTVDLWLVGSICYLCVVVIANMRILISTKSHSLYSFWLVILTISSYYIVLLMMSSMTMFENFDNFWQMECSIKNHFLILLVCSGLIFLDISITRLPVLYGLVKKPYDPSRKEELYSEATSDSYKNRKNDKLSEKMVLSDEELERIKENHDNNDNKDDEQENLISSIEKNERKSKGSEDKYKNECKINYLMLFYFKCNLDTGFTFSKEEATNSRGKSSKSVVEVITNK